MKKKTNILVADDSQNIVEEKVNHAAGLIITNDKPIFQNAGKERTAAELIITYQELTFQNKENKKSAAELPIANKKPAFQNKEKEKQAEEVVAANKKINELEKLLQNNFKEISDYKYALDESSIIAITDQKGIIKKVNNNFCLISKYSWEELIGQDHRIINSGYHAKEFIRHLWLTIANGKIWRGELKNKAKDGTFYWVDTTIVPFLNDTGKPYQYLALRADITARKEAEEYLIQRTAQLETANKKLVFQYEEKEKRAVELGIANKELAFQNKEKEKRAAELIIANKELAFQNDEKEKRSVESGIANKELAFQNIEKEKRAAELIIANKELAFQNDEKGKRAAELSIANKELAFQNDEKEKRAAELIIAYGKLQKAGEELQMQEVIKLSEKSFRQLADLMPQIVWTATPDGLIDYFNKQWFEYNGFNEGHSEQSWIPVLHADDMDRWQKTFTHSIKTGNPYQIEFRFKDSKNPGIYRWFLCRSLPVKDNEANITKWIGTCTDIDDAKRIQEELQQTEQRRANFIKMVSHELKTPVTSIKGYVQLLLMITGDESSVQDPLQVKNSLSRINYQVSRLTRLITEMLDVSRIETGKLELQNTLFSLNDLVTETVEDILHTSTSHTITIHHNVNCTIKGDKDRIEQVIINLLANAIKYSPDNSQIEVSLQLRGNEKNQVAVSVKDYGIGIEAKDYKKIFERFFRVNEENEQTYPGFGIGLFIAKEIIERHNGIITIESEKGKGSVFSFILPLATENIII